MKERLIVILSLISFLTFSQDLITDEDFEDKINLRSAFDDSGESIVIVEFWASFNKDNQFNDYDKLEGVKFYRCDISKSPKAKKSHKVKTIPHLVIFKNGIDEIHFKAGIGFALKATLGEIQVAIKELKVASKF